MHCGIPVVVSDVGDMGALVRQYGVGEAVAPGSCEALAQGMRHVLAAGRARYQAGAAVAAAAFDIRNAARAYLAGH